MAKKHKAKVERFCVHVGMPIYDDRDAVRGTSWRKDQCFRSKKKAVARANRIDTDSDGFGPWVRVVSTKTKRETLPFKPKSIARKLRDSRAWRRDSIPF